MFESLQIDSGKKTIHQSHKNKITHKSLTMFNRMARHKDLLNVKDTQTGMAQIKVEDSFKCSVLKFQEQISHKDPTLQRFQLHFDVFQNNLDKLDEETGNGDFIDDISDQSEDM
jgi:hypothetical protein